MKYDDFLWYIKERQTIRFMKYIASPKPWTDDLILDKCHFLNIQTMHDPGTKRLHDFIKGMTDWEKLFYIFSYRTVYSSQRFLNDMTEIWMHDYRNLKLFNWKSYSERQPYTFHLGSYTVKQFVIDISFPIMKLFWQRFEKLNDASIREIEDDLAMLFTLKVGRKYKLLSSIIATDLALAFPGKVKPDSECNLSITAKLAMKKLPGGRRNRNVENLLNITGLNHSCLNRALGEWYKYLKRKNYYEEKGCFRDEWLIKAL
jgi:hypothetical protein